MIVVSQHEPGEFISPIFFLTKKDGSHRMILNLKKFNEYVQYHHFKMDTLEVAIKLMKPGCYMASVDLEDAYHTVAIHPEHQKYLKFEFNGGLYQYTCLPNGLASAPRIFTKLQGDSVNECNNNITDTVTLFSDIGFFLHPDKSLLSPTQKLTFLGFVLNSLTMTVSPTQDKTATVR